MIQSLHALGRHLRQAVGDDPEAIVEQLALTSADEEETKAGFDEREEEQLGGSQEGRGSQRATFLAVLDFYPNEKCLRHELILVDANVLRRYLWLQLMKFSPGSDVRDVTVRDLRYLLGPIFVGLAPRQLGLEQQQDPALDKLAPLLDPLLPLLQNRGGARREQFILDVNGFQLDPPPLQESKHEILSWQNGQLHLDWAQWDQVERQKKRAGALTELAGKLRAILNWGRKVQYFTLSIDGRPLAQEPAYRQFVFSILVDRQFETAQKGRCHLCGKSELVTSEFIPMRMKVYINDKASFAGSLNKGEGFFERYAVCRNCFIDLLLADRLLEQELQVQLLRTPVFLIPEFLAEPQGDLATVREQLQNVRTVGTELGRLEELRRAPEDIARKAKALTRDYAALTLLFHAKQNMAVKVREVISEVPPSRIQRVITALNRVNDYAEGWAAPFQARQNRAWFGGLNNVLDTLPLRRREGAPIVRPALTLVRQMLQEEPVDRQALEADFLEGARALRNQHSGYWIVPQQWSTRTAKPDEVDWQLRQYIGRTLALRLLLQEIGCITRGGDPVTQSVPEPYREAMDQLSLSDQEQALFLLGVLLARVATEQYGIDKKKPILEKLNYTGMSLPRITTFANELFDKLRQYRLLQGRGAAEHELLFNEAVQRLIRYREYWQLTDAQNVYFLLAGYAYETGRAIQTASIRGHNSNGNC